MSGIVGSRFNIRGSGLVGSLGTDGQVFTSSGAGAGAVFEAAAGGGKLLQVVNATTNPAKTTLASYTFAEVNSTVRATITPTASDSILFLYLHILYGGASSTNISTMKFYDITNSADVNASSDGNRTPGHAASRQVDTDTHDVDSMVLSATVSAASTSARTYGMYSTNEIAGGNTDTKYFFGGNSNISQIPCARATFIIQEWDV